MARTKRKVTEYEEDEPERIVLPRVADPEEETVSSFLAKWGREGAKVRVYRMTPQGKQYCFLAQPEEVDPEFIRLFHSRQTYAHETGQYLIEIEVNGEVRPPFTILIAPQVAAPGLPDGNQGGDGGGYREVIRMLQAQNDRLEARAQQQQKEPIGEVADALLKLDQLRGGGQRELPMDTLIKAIEIGKSLGGNGGGDSWLGLVKEVLPSLAPAVASIATSLTARNPPAPAAQQEEQPMNEEAMLKLGLGYLKKKALAGSDPGLFVDIIVDSREEAPYAQLIRRVLESDFSAFATVDPDIAKPQYEPFFRAIYDGLRSVFIEQNKVDHDSDGPDGDNTDAPGNAKPRQPRGK